MNIEFRVEMMENKIEEILGVVKKLYGLHESLQRRLDTLHTKASAIYGTLAGEQKQEAKRTDFLVCPGCQGTSLYLGEISEFTRIHCHSCGCVFAPKWAKRTTVAKVGV